METWAAIVGGLGVGGALTAIFQAWFGERQKHKSRRFEEKRKAFESLLMAYTELAKGWTDDKAKDFALAEAKVQLVASVHVVQAITQLKESDPAGPDRESAHGSLMLAMRRDLGLT